MRSPYAASAHESTKSVRLGFKVGRDEGCRLLRDDRVAVPFKETPARFPFEEGDTCLAARR